MNDLRLVLVSRRFWPLVGGAEKNMANLAVEFVRRGIPTTVLTARWDDAWTKQVVYRDVTVHRLPNPRRRAWGTFRYMRAVSRWLRRHRQQFDLVYVSMLKHDACAAVGVARHAPVPVVLRAEGGGKTGDCHWQQTANFGRRIKRRCLRADAFVAPSQNIAAELAGAGYASDRIVQIPNGVVFPIGADRVAKKAARSALAEADYQMALPEHAPLAVYTGRLMRSKGLINLVAAWRTVVQRWPNARLWLVGHGPDRGTLIDKIHHLELKARVILPGVFDDVGELLRAADLFVLPSHEEGMSIALLEAMATGLPIVATDIPGNRALITNEEHGLLFPPGNVQSLAESVHRLLDDPSLATRLAEAARQRVKDHFTIARSADEHEQLFRRLAAEVGDW